MSLLWLQEMGQKRLVSPVVSKALQLLMLIIYLNNLYKDALGLLLILEHFNIEYN